jgi:hypothetical protein
MELVPAPVQVLRCTAELHHQIAGQVLRLNVAALLSPQPQDGGIILTHHDSRVRAADE